MNTPAPSLGAVETVAKPDCDICGRPYQAHQGIVGAGMVCPVSAVTYRPKRSEALSAASPTAVGEEGLVERVYKQGYADGNSDGHDEMQTTRPEEAWNLRKKWFAAALSASRARIEAEVIGWQPIETAPKDGAMILGYGEHLPTYFYALVWEDGEWRYCSQGRGWAAPPGMPTHWRPLPEPPLPITKAGERDNGDERG